jgi:hypothetical protein
MRVLKTIGHPVLVISLFLLILISGAHFGSIYLHYILLGLMGNVPHAWLAIGGLTAQLIGYKIYRNQSHWIKPFCYLLGIALMALALYTFFIRSEGYNDATFEQIVPLISLGLFGSCALCNVLLSLGQVFKLVQGKKDSPQI